MSVADPRDIFQSLAGVSENAGFDNVVHIERRKRVRTQVRWRVLFRCYGHETIETVTENLSSGGFYCSCRMVLKPGEPVTCILLVPAQDPHDQGRTLALECKGTVVRAEAMPDGLFGIACRIDDYRMSAGFAWSGADSDAECPLAGRQGERGMKEQGK